MRYRRAAQRSSRLTVSRPSRTKADVSGGRGDAPYGRLTGMRAARTLVDS